MASGSRLDLGYQAYSLCGESEKAFIGPGALVLLKVHLVKWAKEGVRASVVAEDRKLADWLDAQLTAWAKLGKTLPDLSTITNNTLSQVFVSWHSANDCILGDLEATQVVGKSIWHRSQSGQVIPSFDVPIEELEFTEQEYLTIREEVDRTGRMYARMGRIEPVLSELNSGIFRHQSQEESRLFLEEKLTVFRNQTRILHQDYGRALDQFARYFEALESKQIRQIISHAEGCVLALRQIDIAASKKHIQGKKEKAWNQWLTAVGSFDLFAFELPENIDKVAIEQLLEWLGGYLRKSKNYTRNKGRRLREAAIGLSSNTLPAEDLLAVRLQELEDRRKRLISDLNESGLYQLPIKEAAATSLRQYKSLENLLQKLDRGLALLDRYEWAYKWQQNWFALKPPTRRILRALLLMPVAEWSSLFESWYLEQVYQHKAESYYELPKAETRLSAAAELDEQRFYPYGFVPPKVGVLEETPLEKAGHTIIFYRQLPDKIEGEDQGNIFHFALFPNGKSSHRYMALTGADLAPGLAFFQPLQLTKFPAWTVKEDFSADDSKEGELSQIRIDLNAEASDAAARQSVYVSLHEPEELFQSYLFALAYAMSSGQSMVINHRLTEREITQQLLDDGFTLPFLCAAAIRAAQAVADHDFAAYEAIAQESRRRLGLSKPQEHPLLLALTPYLPTDSYALNQPWRSTFLPLVIRSKSTGLRTVVLPGGRLPGRATAVEECLRQSELYTAGFALYDLPAYRAVEEWERVVEEVKALSD